MAFCHSMLDTESIAAQQHQYYFTAEIFGYFEPKVEDMENMEEMDRFLSVYFFHFVYLTRNQLRITNYEWRIYNLKFIIFNFQ
ncbi:MAG: hypothetical protein A2X61_09310 [Ignavibacteria bacterium GWB2_35_12]|nr:MAG: hypothetical protein A2X63_03920 [Ignavibacteria bacterium GWA2_35_8]OGU38176.1 MAG: hypothetical protein A2X61_09310 [Ignavibacteria bacterium GWB2_35_12]OGU93932.1 MAG: hypothetical protein A2220_03935 [Ignavibacteria bacterium RIFOXYA2_FULL_35_10]OGV20033.1 MAG: hypothetical protein A2475_03035 [Ignavibacteria bacterium RIFOXYC2_FULL_35_21]